MCNHETLHAEFDNCEMDFSWLARQENAFKQATIVTVTGGEPLIIKSGRRFISWFLQNEKFMDVELHICTNGLVLDNFIPLFKDRNVGLEISLDGYGESYERIRVGSSWQRVANNIDTFLAMNKERRPNHLSVRIHCTIMRTGLTSLPALTEWAVQRGVGMHFALMETRNPAAQFESVLDYPAMLLSIPRWETYFDKTIEILTQTGGHHSEDAVQLALIFDKLSTAARTAALPQSKAQKYKQQRDALAASRWRKLGRRLGIVKTLPFEVNL
jgi:sulfatase maturation enzyme AslB (radical SAM superfamily)